MHYHVYGLGNALVDMEYEINDGFLAQHEIAKGHMTLVEAERLQGLAAPGALALAGSLAPYLSGALRRGAPGGWVRLKGLRRRRWVLHRTLTATAPSVNFG